MDGVPINSTTFQAIAQLFRLWCNERLVVFWRRRQERRSGLSLPSRMAARSQRSPTVSCANQLCSGRQGQDSRVGQSGSDNSRPATPDAHFLTFCLHTPLLFIRSSELFTYSQDQGLGIADFDR